MAEVTTLSRVRDLAEGILAGRCLPGRQWMDFQSGTLPGVHPERWPEWVPSVLRDRLSADSRVVSGLFSRASGSKPSWRPSWYQAGKHPVASLLEADPRSIPVLHRMVAAALGVPLLGKLISSSERKAVSDFLGEAVLNDALYVYPRLSLPDFTPWFGSGTLETGLAGVLSRRAGLVLMEALSGTPVEFRDQVMATLPVSAESGDTPLPQGEAFANASRRLVLLLAPRLTGSHNILSDRLS